MGIKKVTGIAELDSVIGALNKRFNKENLVTMGPSRESLVGIPTGSVALDVAIGIGGLPKGRIIEIFGPESSGKTSLSLKIAAMYEEFKHTIEQGHRKCLVVDLEHSITIDLLLGVGLDPDEILWVKPDTAEEAFQSMMDLVKTGCIGFALLDSIDAAQSEAQLKKKFGENEMGGISKLTSKFFREFSKVCDNTQTTAVFINQIRQNPGQMMGDPTVTPGGKALGFYASLRLQTMNWKASKDRTDAMHMRVKVKKNKCAPPRIAPVEFDFIYAQGPDPINDLIACAKSLGILRFAGPSCKVTWPGEEEQILIGGGKLGVTALLNENPEVRQKLLDACFVAAGMGKNNELDSEDQSETESATG